MKWCNVLINYHHLKFNFFKSFSNLLADVFVVDVPINNINVYINLFLHSSPYLLIVCVRCFSTSEEDLCFVVLIPSQKYLNVQLVDNLPVCV